MCKLSVGLGYTFLCPAWAIGTLLMKHRTRPSEHTAKAKLVSKRDKECTGCFVEIVGVHDITIKIMKRGNSENPK